MRMFYLREAPYDQELGNTRPLHMNNLGFYEENEEPITVARPNGRRDYHLIYVVRGEVLLENGVLRDGEYCIFYPQEPQYYTYTPQEGCRYLWAHFTGSHIKDLLTGELLSHGTHKAKGKENQVDTLFSLILQGMVEGNDDYALSLFHSLFLLLSSPIKTATPFSRAKRALESTQDTTIESLAQIYHMSVEHFIRSFKSYYGTTPANYRVRARLSKAKSLLTDTTLSISTIAEMCGYDDPLYFSRLFKRHIGISPQGYRKSLYQ